MIILPKHRHESTTDLCRRILATAHRVPPEYTEIAATFRRGSWLLCISQVTGKAQPAGPWTLSAYRVTGHARHLVENLDADEYTSRPITSEQFLCAAERLILPQLSRKAVDRPCKRWLRHSREVMKRRALLSTLPPCTVLHCDPPAQHYSGMQEDKLIKIRTRYYQGAQSLQLYELPQLHQHQIQILKYGATS